MFIRLLYTFTIYIIYNENGIIGIFINDLYENVFIIYYIYQRKARVFHS